MKQRYFQLVFLTKVSASYAQSITVNGVVLDGCAVPLSAATILQEGTTNEVSAGLDGNL